MRARQRLTVRCVLWFRLDLDCRHGQGVCICDGAAPGQVGAIGAPLPLPIHLHLCHIWQTLVHPNSLPRVTRDHSDTMVQSMIALDTASAQQVTSQDDNAGDFNTHDLMTQQAYHVTDYR